MKKVEIFNSIGEFMNVTNNRGENTVFNDGRSLSAREVSIDRTEFTGTENYEEAESLFAGGWMKGKKYLTEITTGKKAFAPTPAYQRKRTQAGGRLHIGALIAQSDQVWVRRKRTLKDSISPVVSVFYDLSIPGGIDKKDLAEASGKLFSAIRDLENDGYKVELYIGNTSDVSDNRTACVIRLKNSNEPLNEVKFLYPCVHPSFFRRHIFRWIETTPIITSRSYRYGYGRCFCGGESDTKTIKDMINTAGKKFNSVCRAYRIYNDGQTTEEIKQSILAQRAEAVK